METTMKTKRETLQRLKNVGKFGESYDKVVNRLLDEVEKDGDIQMELNRKSRESL